MNTTGPKGPRGLWSDVLLAKTDSKGNVEWARSYGSTGPDEIYTSALAPAGGFLFGGTYSTSGDRKAAGLLLLKVDSEGEKEWARIYSGSSKTIASHITNTADGGWAIAANIDSSRSDGQDILLLKTDYQGNLKRARTYGGNGIDGAQMVTETSDGGFILAGSTASFGDTGTDAIFLKTDELGNQQWALTFGKEGRDAAFSAVESAPRTFTIAGNTEGYGPGSHGIFLIQVRDPEKPGTCLRPVKLIQSSAKLSIADPVLDGRDIDLNYQSDSLRKQRVIPIEH